MKGVVHMAHDINIDNLKEIYENYKDYSKSTSKISPENDDVRERTLKELEEKNPYFSRYVYSGIINV